MASPSSKNIFLGCVGCYGNRALFVEAGYLLTRLTRSWKKHDISINRFAAVFGSLLELAALQVRFISTEHPRLGCRGAGARAEGDPSTSIPAPKKAVEIVISLQPISDCSL